MCQDVGDVDWGTVLGLVPVFPPIVAGMFLLGERPFDSEAGTGEVGLVPGNLCMIDPNLGLTPVPCRVRDVTDMTGDGGMTGVLGLVLIDSCPN